MTFRAGQTVTGPSLSGPVTGTVIRVRPSIIDRSVLIVDIDVDGQEHHVPAEDCALARAPRAATPEEPVTATTEAPRADQQAPAPSHGWMHPNNSHLAHWGDGTRVLCGRMVPAGTEIVGTDPYADVQRCSKCDKTLQRDLKTTVQKRLAAGRTDFPASEEAGDAAESPAYAPQAGDDVRVRTGRHDVAVIVNVRGDEVQVLYADGTRPWVPVSALEKAHTAEQPEQAQPAAAPAPEVAWAVGMTVEFTYGWPQPDTREQGVITKIFDDGNRRYNKDCQVKYSKAFYYRNFDDFTLVEVQESAPATAEPVEESQPAAPAPAAQFEVPQFEAPTLGLQTVPWNRILNSSLNPRKHFDADSLRELAVSIYRKGLQQNLVARPHPDRPGYFEIAAGERRWRAIGLLTQGFEVDGHEWLEWPASTPVNVLVQDLTDLELLEVATAENVQRRRMTPIEEADAFAALADHGSPVEDIAAKFGYTRRTVIRRIQISRALSPLLRDEFNTGNLTLAQVEVLVTVAPEVQEAVWNGYLRSNPRLYPPEHIRKHLPNNLFLVRHRQFPPAWYTGGVVEADLFDDVEPYFQDPAQAMECQLRHARVLADQDVAGGAAFAEVVLNAMRHHYGDSGSGVVYSVKNSGEMERWENIGARRSWSPLPDGGYSIKNPAPDSSASSSTPQGAATQSSAAQASAPQAAQTPEPRYPAPWSLDDIRIDAALTGPDRRRRLQAAYILDSMLDREVPHITPELTSAADRLELLFSTHLKRNGDGWTLGAEPKDETAELAVATEILRLLLTLTGADLDTLFYGYFHRELSFSNTAAPTALGNLDPFTLTEGFLAACDTLALQEIWDDAGLGDRANTTDEYLRSMLLEEAPALAARGFLPRPLRPEAADD
ncbi:ParB/RepB/Spo0J family partition protein [Deinococcus sp. 6YEL10]|uniref:ParB/RepB/Spo0J family partition protein n=1 Tax=Deinococcus sp. 6YEL10 TaxID=2745870 RepID=UPI001E65BBE2|nr:ParB/RepB/Spo0J family partition protein [Deinococcus sp. 6YEL10]